MNIWKLFYIAITVTVLTFMALYLHIITKDIVAFYGAEYERHTETNSRNTES